MKLTSSSSGRNPRGPIYECSPSQQPNRPHIPSYPSMSKSTSDKTTTGQPKLNLGQPDRVLPTISENQHPPAPVPIHPAPCGPGVSVNRYLGPTTKRRKQENEGNRHRRYNCLINNDKLGQSYFPEPTISPYPGRKSRNQRGKTRIGAESLPESAWAVDNPFPWGRIRLQIAPIGQPLSTGRRLTHATPASEGYRG